MIAVSPATTPENHHDPPISAPTFSSTELPVRFTPPLIAMVVIIATAFVTITYSRAISRRFLRFRRRWRQWRRRRRLFRSFVQSSAGDDDIESIHYSGAGSFDQINAYRLFPPYGLDEAFINKIPLSIHTRKSSFHECAVCLLEFDDHDCVRTLPVCFHAFHVDCIDTWLKAHANCPLCRASVYRPDLPFVPVMSARIRPSYEDMMIESAILELLTETEHPPGNDDITRLGEITEEQSPRRNLNLLDDRFNRRDYLLKRSYSFEFDRNTGSETLIMEPATASPWKYRPGVGSFWISKRPSPFSSLTKPMVFSFGYYKAMKSPFFRRRSVGVSFFPSSESNVRYSRSSIGDCISSRRSKSFASPMLINSGIFSSSQLRSGDPEALLSPERYNRR